jgi:acid phosphatase
MFTKQSLVTLLGGLSVALAQTSSEQYPSIAEIEAAQATVQPYSPVSNVRGLAFNRFVNIWLENTVCDTLLKSSFQNYTNQFNVAGL